MGTPQRACRAAITTRQVHVAIHSHICADCSPLYSVETTGCGGCSGEWERPAPQAAVGPRNACHGLKSALASGASSQKSSSHHAMPSDVCTLAVILALLYACHLAAAHIPDSLTTSQSVKLSCVSEHWLHMLSRRVLLQQ